MDFAPMLSVKYWRKLATKWLRNWNHSERFCNGQPALVMPNCASEFLFSAEISKQKRREAFYLVQSRKSLFIAW